MTTTGDENLEATLELTQKRQTHCNHNTDAGLSADGRVARRQRNRERVVDAYVELLGEGVANPTAAELAERTELTSRSVYRHMQADSTLKSDIAERIIAVFRSAQHTVIPDRATLPERLDAFVTTHLEMYAQGSQIMRAIRGHVEADSIVLETINAIQAIAREQLSTSFAPELAPLAAEERHAEVVAMHTLLTFASLEYLHQHVAPELVHNVIRRHLHALLTARECSAAAPSEPKASVLRQ